MNELMLKSFLEILASIVALRKDYSFKIISKYLENFIEKNFGKKLVKTKLDEFSNLLDNYQSVDILNDSLPLVCKSINQQFTVKHKFLIVINILNFFSTSQIVTTNTRNVNEDVFSLLAKLLNLNQHDFLNCLFFSYDQLHVVPQREKLVIVANENPNISDISFFKNEGLKGYLNFLFLETADMLIFRYNGASKLEINSKPIFTKHTYILQGGTYISGRGIPSIYFGEILRAILHDKSFEAVTLDANNVSYQYPRTHQGITNVSISARSGELIGILGASGVGKSTIIKVLCGNLKPQNGEVLINGLNLYSNWYKFKGITGVMHQEESLIEELTVYENLFYSAKLSLGNVPEAEIKKMVEDKLYELELFEFMHNKVGPPENRQLSGGQRKRLAIAMEIIREPKILFADEPTSGLSSADSETVMRILKNIALEGKLVVVNIHQPSSEVFKLFDSVLVVDKGGIPVFNGNPLEAILHFKKISDRVDKDKSSCEYCGTVKPELIFELLEERTVDEIGQRSQNRKFSPDMLHEMFLEKISSQSKGNTQLTIPKALFQKAGVFSQFLTFLKRNVITKIRNVEFLIFALALPPFLSLIISFFLRYSIPSGVNEQGYSLYYNPNVPSFFFMCILSSLFFGVIVSCDDILREKRILIREQYIGLSLKSFYNSKIVTLAILSAIQTFAFLIPGLIILEIKDVGLMLWLVLFLLSIIGNLMGLILSSTLKSVVSVYILVPFLLVPQILFSGLVVRFDNLNTKYSNPNFVPLVGELMASRWAVEGIMVHFFQKNSFQKPFFNIDLKESELRFNLLYLLPELNQKVTELNNLTTVILPEQIQELKSGFDMLSINKSLPNHSVLLKKWDENTPELLLEYLETTKNFIASRYTQVKHQRDLIIEEIYPNNESGRKRMIDERNKYHSRAIEELVRNKHYPSPLIIENNRYVKKIDPIFHVSDSKIGLSHFFAPFKRIGSVMIETYWFNLLLLSIMIVFLYLLNIFNVMPTFFKRKFI